MGYPITNEDLQAEVRELKAEVRDLQASIQDLLDAWKTVGGLVRFVKFAAGFIAAVVGAWVAIRALFH